MCDIPPFYPVFVMISLFLQCSPFKVLPMERLEVSFEQFLRDLFTLKRAHTFQGAYFSHELSDRKENLIIRDTILSVLMNQFPFSIIFFVHCHYITLHIRGKYMHRDGINYGQKHTLKFSGFHYMNVDPRL